jgi:hypothetical protein
MAIYCNNKTGSCSCAALLRIHCLCKSGGKRYLFKAFCYFLKKVNKKWLIEKKVVVEIKTDEAL